MHLLTFAKFCGLLLSNPAARVYPSVFRASTLPFSSSTRSFQQQKLPDTSRSTPNPKLVIGNVDNYVTRDELTALIKEHVMGRVGLSFPKVKKAGSYITAKCKSVDVAQRLVDASNGNGLHLRGKRLSIGFARLRTVSAEKEYTEGNGKSVFVGGLRWDVTEADLQALFTPYEGDLAEVYIGRTSGDRSFGWARLVTDSKATADAIVEQHKKTPFILSRRALKVNIMRFVVLPPSSVLYFRFLSSEEGLKGLREKLKAQGPEVQEIVTDNRPPPASITSALAAPPISGWIKFDSVDKGTRALQVLGNTQFTGGRFFEVMYSANPHPTPAVEA